MERCIECTYAFLTCVKHARIYIKQHIWGLAAIIVKDPWVKGCHYKQIRERFFSSTQTRTPKMYASKPMTNNGRTRFLIFLAFSRLEFLSKRAEETTRPKSVIETTGINQKETKPKTHGSGV